MGLAEAVRSVLTQYTTFTGRARRSEYWYWQLALLLLSIVYTILALVIGTGLIGDMIVWSYWLLTLAVILPGLAVLVRRLHDTNRSGWWMLIVLIPLVGWIILLVFLVMPSDTGSNQYGPPPA